MGLTRSQCSTRHRDRYPPETVDSSEYRGGGRVLTRKELFSRPQWAPFSKGPTGEVIKDMRPAGVSIRQQTDTQMNDAVGYKDVYWRLEHRDNPERKNVLNILKATYTAPEPARPGKEIPVKRLDLPQQAGRFVNQQCDSFR